MINQDALLVAGVKAGAEDAFTAVVERYQGAIGRYLLRLVGDPALAEELCQETFFRAYRAIFRTGDELALKPWLYRIATNAAYSVLRRRQPRGVPLEQAERRRSSDSRAYLEHLAHQRDAVQRTLMRLQAEYAVPLVLSAVEGFSYQEVAAILGMSAEAARKRVYRAKLQFRVVYEELERE
jgi:RNA polymerase sigma-70 factor (ECF subfamily)